MKITRVEEVVEIPNPHQVSVRALHASEHIQVEYLLLQPGDALKKHVASVNVTLFVLNEGETPFCLLNVKAPRPTIPTRVI